MAVLLSDRMTAVTTLRLLAVVLPDPDLLFSGLLKTLTDDI